MSKSKPKAAKAKQAKHVRKPRPNAGELTDDALETVAGGVDSCLTPVGSQPVPIPSPGGSQSGIPSGALKKVQPSQLLVHVDLNTSGPLVIVNGVNGKYIP